MASRRFLYVILGIFVLESAWITLSAVYPQAFDEQFHFGLIKVYSHHWLPFLTAQPPHAAAFGAVARDPSYLYHYLMSFPFRLIELFTGAQAAQIIILRFINIALFGGGLILFRRVMLRGGLSKSLANLSLFLFILIPIVPQLAGQINYDNLLFLMVPVVCLLTFNAVEEIKKRRPSARTLLILLAICILTSLVKYAFLPIFLAVVVFLGFYILRRFRGQIGKFFKLLMSSFKNQSLRSKIILLAVLVISLGLFGQRDGVNFVKYHAVTPNCAKVLSLKSCSHYGAWNADYVRRQRVKSGQQTPSDNIFSYSAKWLFWMNYRSFFAVNGLNSNFKNYAPLPLPAAAAAVIALLALIVTIRYFKQIFRKNPYALFLLIATGVYVVSLFIKGYATYQSTDVLENMNGRYLLPILLMLAVIAGRGFSVLLKRFNFAKVIVGVVMVVLFLDGGGLLTFIDRSDASWDWHNSAVVKVNHAARQIVKPIIYDGRKQPPTAHQLYSFL